MSEATVSRVLNNVGPIREETKRKVLLAAKELNYVPNAIAQSFARRKSGNIGVVLPFLPKVRIFSSYYFSEILSGIGEQVKEAGNDLLLLFKPIDETMDYSMSFKTGKVDALIILGARDVESERRELKRLKVEGYPFCLVGQHFPNESFPGVDADHVQGSLQAMRHLLENGNRRIAFLNGSKQYSNSADRYKGYCMALQEAGIPVDQSLILEGNYSRTSGYRAAQTVCGWLDRVDAIFIANDRMAVGLMQGLKEKGIIVGKQLSVVGYDNTDAAMMCDPPLTTVHVPFYEIGKKAAEKMIEQVELGNSEYFYERLPTHLVVRNSSIRTTHSFQRDQINQIQRRVDYTQTIIN